MAEEIRIEVMMDKEGEATMTAHVAEDSSKELGVVADRGAD